MIKINHHPLQIEFQNYDSFSQIVSSLPVDRHSQALTSGAASTVGSQRKVYESIFSLSTDTEGGGGYLSSNPCSVHVLQEGSRPLHAFHRTNQQPAQV
jgi:hypothetical protein